MTPLLMSLLLLAALGLFSYTAVRRWRLMCAAATPDDRFDRVGDRLRDVLLYMFGQLRMFRYRGAGVAHAFIFGGFVVLLLRTLALFARGYAGVDSGFGFWLFDDHRPLGVAYLFLKDLVGVLVIAGVAYFLYTRLVTRPRRLELSREGVLILCMILGIILSDMFYEAGGYVRLSRGVHAGLEAEVQRQIRSQGAAFEALGATDTRQAMQQVAEDLLRPLRARLAAQNANVFHVATPAASILAVVLQGLPTGLVNVLFYGGFWLHGLLVLAFLNFLPYGKHFHVLTVLPNVYFHNLDGIGRVRTIGDIEQRIEQGRTLGVARARDLSWKSVLDLYTCTECGRCSDHCPATNTGKLLSPKHLSIALRDHMYANQPALLASRAANPQAGPADGQRSQSGPSPAGAAPPAFIGPQGKPLAEGEPGADGALVPTWIEPETLWACTTCGACEQECPVFISYIDKIVDMRRHLVMERGEFPDQLQNAFRGLESVGNPYSFANEQRAEWAAGLDIPLCREKPDADVLYWVGCAPSFDDRSRKIARATAQLLKQAGVDFAILGPQEKCTGDPARRAGNEYLFQAFANENVATLNSYNVRKIVTTCPHCFNTLKNEYPDFGGRYEVVHHTDFLLQLVRAGRLKPRQRVEGTVVYHDSCYLGRYNDVYDPPRELLKSIPGLTVVEALESRDRGMCCGAGGAQMWKEEEHAVREESKYGNGKVNHARARQLLNVLPSSRQPQRVASACPFCMTMLRDGLRDQGHEDVIQEDIAELLLRSVEAMPGE
jgi:Fe-S oxidoreductase